MLSLQQYSLVLFCTWLFTHMIVQKEKSRCVYINAVSDIHDSALERKKRKIGRLAGCLLDIRLFCYSSEEYCKHCNFSEPPNFIRQLGQNFLMKGSIKMIY